MRKQIIMHGLHCANCAEKIKREIKNIKGVKEVNLNFITNTITLNFFNNVNTDKIIEEAVNIIHKYEPHVTIEFNRSNNVKQDEEQFIDKFQLIKIIIGSIFFLLGLILSLNFYLELSLFLLSYILIGWEVLLRALRNIFKGNIFDENFLMFVATLGAFIIKEFPEAVAVMLFYQIGEFFQDLAVHRSKRSIKALLNIKPQYTNLVFKGKEEKVNPEKVEIGDIIAVKPGERIPLDGVVIAGESFLDTSALTGESLPRKVVSGQEVLSGSINTSGLIKIKVTKKFNQSTVYRILELVQNASTKKAATENFITKFAKVYTPLVVFLAFLVAFVPPLILKEASFFKWFYRALIFLVVSCPCALVISIPLGFFGGIGGASRQGILIKGGNYLEGLNQVSTIVFDKTGTLTKGVFKVTEVKPVQGFTEDEVLKFAAIAESNSNHPIARSILKAYQGNINLDFIKNYQELPGLGVKVKYGEKEIIVGNAKFMLNEKIKFKNMDEILGTVVYVAVNKTFVGSILISDEMKENVPETINSLRNLGINQIIMLTGDNRKVGDFFKEKLNLDKVYGELLPEDKVEKLEILLNNKEKNKKLVYVGDGINDAPVLARADIGVAMGGLGADAAIEVADIVLMTDEPQKLITAIKIAKRTKNIIWQNIILSLGVKGFVLILGTLGIATMWEAIFADVGVALMAVLNSMRVLRTQNI